MKARRITRSAAVALVTTFVLGVPAATLVRGATQPPFPAEKQALLDASAQARDAALKAPRPPKDPLTAPPVRLPEPAWATGIIDSGQAPFPGSVYSFENQWHEIVGGEHANVYAGALRQDRAQGVLALEFTALDITGDATTGGIYPTPLKAGPIRIVAAAAGRVMLLAEDGTQFAFDLATRRFTVL
jgi:hypothetical protein